MYISLIKNERMMTIRYSKLIMDCHHSIISATKTVLEGTVMSLTTGPSLHAGHWYLVLLLVTEYLSSLGRRLE